jgi:hypothetical protein
MPELELLSEYTAERVGTNARVYQQLLRSIPEPTDTASAREVAGRHLHSYLDSQLERLHDWAEAP